MLCILNLIYLWHTGGFSIAVFVWALITLIVDPFFVVDSLGWGWGWLTGEMLARELELKSKLQNVFF